MEHRVLLEKLKVLHSIKEFHSFYGNRSLLNTVVHNRLLLVPILIQINSFRALPSCYV